MPGRVCPRFPVSAPGTRFTFPAGLRLFPDLYGFRLESRRGHVSPHHLSDWPGFSPQRDGDFFRERELAWGRAAKRRDQRRCRGRANALQHRQPCQQYFLLWRSLEQSGGFNLFQWRQDLVRQFWANTSGLRCLAGLVRPEWKLTILGPIFWLGPIIGAISARFKARPGIMACGFMTAPCTFPAWPAVPRVRRHTDFGLGLESSTTIQSFVTSGNGHVNHQDGIQ